MRTWPARINFTSCLSACTTGLADNAQRGVQSSYVEPNSEALYWPSYGLELGRRLRILRIMRGLTQERLAELSGYSRNQISNLERNQNRTQHSSNPSMKMIYSLARALHVPPLVLLPRAERLVLARCDSGASTELAVKATWPETAQDVSRFSMSYLVGDAPSTEVRESPPFDLHLVRPDGLADDEWGSLIGAAATLSASEQKILEVLDKLEKREIKDQEEPGDPEDPGDR